MSRRLVCMLPALYFLSIAAAHAACDCLDAGTIRNRLVEANTAIAAYTTEMVKMAEQQVRTGTPVTYTPARRARLQGIVKSALDTAMAGRAATAPVEEGGNPGGTDNLCRTSLNLREGVSACMRDSLTRHEDYHRAQCQKTLSAGKVAETLVNKTDRFERNGVMLADYAKEEIDAYSAEVKFLQDELARLAKAEECKPKQRPPPPKPQLRDYTAQPRR